MRAPFLLLLLTACVPLCAEPNSKLDVDTRLVVDAKSETTKLVFEVRNTTNQPQRVDKPGINGSPLFIVTPTGKKSDLRVIIDYLDPAALPLLPPGTILKTEEDETELLRTFLPTGLYQLLFESNGVQAPPVLIYREHEAPKLLAESESDIRFNELAAELVRLGSFESYYAQFLQEQAEASEGTKQYLFTHPYTMALSFDGKPGFRLKLMATNNTQQPLELTNLNTPQNRLEIVGDTKDRVWIYPYTPLQDSPTTNVTLQVGETHSWLANIGGFLEPSGIRNAGRYSARWMVGDKEVANFVFYLPSRERPAPTP